VLLLLLLLLMQCATHLECLAVHLLPITCQCSVSTLLSLEGDEGNAPDSSSSSSSSSSSGGSRNGGSSSTGDVSATSAEQVDRVWLELVRPTGTPVHTHLQ
jgi:uncharacterized membrane protein YgcG